MCSIYKLTKCIRNLVLGNHRNVSIFYWYYIITDTYERHNAPLCHSITIFDISCRPLTQCSIITYLTYIVYYDQPCPNLPLPWTDVQSYNQYIIPYVNPLQTPQPPNHPHLTRNPKDPLLWTLAKTVCARRK